MKHFLNKNVIIIALIQILYFSDKGWTEPIPVFVSIAPQKYFVERIGGDEVKVHVMVKAGESPATFNPNPKKMSELGIENAWDFETLLKEKVKISLPYLTKGRTSSDYFLLVSKDDSYVPSKIQKKLRLAKKRQTFQLVII